MALRHSKRLLLRHQMSYGKSCPSTVNTKPNGKNVDHFFLDKKGLNRPKKPSHATVPLRVDTEPDSGLMT